MANQKELTNVGFCFRLFNKASITSTLIALIAMACAVSAAPSLAAQESGDVGQEEKSEATETADTRTAEADDAKTKSDDSKKKESKSKDALKQKGPIQEIAKPLDDLMDLTWKSGQLRLTTKTTYEEIDPVVDAIREIVGWGNGNSSYGDGTTFNFDIQSEKIRGHIRREKKNKVLYTSIAIEEVVKPFRNLQIKTSDEGELRVNVIVRETAFILRIHQSPEGEFMVQEVDGTDVFSGVAPDFDSFCRQHRKYSADRLIPAIKHFGLGQVLTPHSPEIQKRVTALIAPWQPDDLTKVRELTRELDSEVYSEREAAASKLDSKYKGNETLLARLVQDNQFHPETRARTRMLIRNRMDQDKLAELDFVGSVVSSLDAAYLMDLIRAQSDSAVRDLLVDRLRQTSPEWIDAKSSNADVVTMAVSQSINAFVSDQVGNAADSTEPEIKLLEEKGPIQKISDNVGQLVKLVWKDDQLSVDRKHWKEPFGGREIIELSDEVKKLVQKNNLPKHWFSSGGRFAASSTRHPHVLFELMEEKAGGEENSQSHHYSHNGNSSLNRQFNSGKLKAELTFDKTARRNRGSSSGKIDKKPFVLMLAEQKKPFRTMTIDENKPGVEMQIMIVGDSSNFLVQLLVKKDSAIIQDVRGTRVFAKKASTFRELQEKNPEYFRDSFFPLLRHMGMQIDPEVDSGPGTNETTSTSGKPNNKTTVKSTDKTAVAGN